MIHYVDLDECQGSNDCDENAQCHNIEGSYNCTCLTGYSGSGFLCCKIVCDQQECKHVYMRNLAFNYH